MTNPCDPAGAPPTAPSRAELWRRNQLALSVLNQRAATTETVVLARRILSGETIETLTREAS